MRLWPWMLIGLLGCGSEPVERGWTVSENDGVRLVSVSVDPAALPEYAAVGAAEWTIGSRDGGVEYVFGSIGDVRSLPNGGVLVTEQMDQTARLYDEAGTHRRTLGGQGDGPGEFRILWIADVVADSIWTWDPLHQRVTLLSLDGGLGPILTFDHEPAARPFEMTRLGDGTYVARSRYRELDPFDPKFQEPRIWTDSLVLRHLDSTGVDLDTIVVTASHEVTRAILPSSEGDGRPVGSHRPFGAMTYWAAGDQGTTVTVEGRSGAITLRDLTGRTLAEVRFEAPLPPLPSSEVARVRESWLEGTENDPGLRRVVDRVFSEEVLPKTTPRASGVKVGSSGEIWVAEHATFLEEVNEWFVFSPEGEPLGRVVLPERFEAHEFGPDFVLGVQRDEFDVEYVQRLPMERLIE